MDDLWGNAWGSPDDKDEGNLTTSTWAISEKSRNDDFQEADLSMPSWSTGPGIRWDEPSYNQSSPLWSNVHHATQDLSLEDPYADIPLGDSRPPEPEGDKNTTDELAIEPESHSSPSSPLAPSDDIHDPSPSRGLDEEVSHSPVLSSAPSPSPEPSPSSSPDAFGTFTVGTEHNDNDATPFPTFGSSTGSQLDGNEWGSPWRNVPKDPDAGAAPHATDEWESARQRQLEMDRRVPPEQLSQILLHLEELTNDAWPESQDVTEENWQRRWNSGMDIDGLESILPRYIPALTLPQLRPSSGSFIAKAMADAVKLSRNTALARTSPMSIFLASKGSTAWETSVKSRLETTTDEVPAGWRILEKDPKKDEKAEEKAKKPTGLLAGLWGRRASNSPSTAPGQQQGTPSSNVTAPENAPHFLTQNQRSSSDGVKTPSEIPPTSQPLPQPFHERSSSQDEDTDALPPASAVSRFLQRFSRPRASSSSPRDSLALSGDDLEFLSDVRSKSTDPSHTVGELIAGLESMVDGGTGSSTLPGKLPPPLPPPPNFSSAPSRGLIAPPRGNASNRNTLISPDDPVANPILDLQSLADKPAISAFATLTPSPITIIDTPPPRSMPLNSAFSHPMPLDRTTPSPRVSGTSVPPLSSSQPGPVMNSPSVTQPQLQLTSGYTAQSLDISQDDDDFTDFRSSPADPPLFPLDVSLSSPDQVKDLTAQSSLRQSSSPFDDLVHLMSSPTTGPSTTFEEPDAPRGFNFANPARSTTPSLPKPRETTPGHKAGHDFLVPSPTHGRSNSQQPISPTKATPASPQQKKIAQGHKRTQSLLDLAATRKGRWPAPPSPLPEPILPPPPPSEQSGGGIMNVDYFGAATPTNESSVIPPLPPGKTPSRLPSLDNAASSQVDSSTKALSPAPSAFDSLTPPRSGSPLFTLSAPPPGQSVRRALSPPPAPTMIMSKPSSKPPSSSSTPVPLLPPPSGFRLPATPQAMPAKAPLSPDSTPLALLLENEKGKNIGLPAATKAPLPPPVKGTGGLTAQDLSFFEGL